MHILYYTIEKHVMIITFPNKITDYNHELLGVYLRTVFVRLGGTKQPRKIIQSNNKVEPNNPKKSVKTTIKWN